MLQMILASDLAWALPAGTRTALWAVCVAWTFDFAIGILFHAFLGTRRIVKAILLAILERVEAFQLTDLLLLAANAW